MDNKKKKAKKVKPAVPDCLYNHGVACKLTERANCAKCGWNPNK